MNRDAEIVLSAERVFTRLRENIELKFPDAVGKALAESAVNALRNNNLEKLTANQVQTLKEVLSGCNPCSRDRNLKDWRFWRGLEVLADGMYMLCELGWSRGNERKRLAAAPQ